METPYTQSFIVQGYECDTENRLSLGSLLRRVQQIGTDQCTQLGIDDAFYKRTHTGFLIAKMAAELYLPIPAQSKVILRTYPSAPQRAAYYRYTTLSDEDGTLLAAVDSRWVLADVLTRRILRRAPEEMPAVFTQPPYHQLEMSIQKAEMQFQENECAAYSRCDLNHHLNNTYYADIVCDHLPQGELLHKRPTRFAINYHKEIPLGSTFELHFGKTGENSWYFSGQTPEKCHFEAEITL